MKAIQTPVAAYRCAGEIALRQATASKSVRFSCVRRPRREILDLHVSGEFENEEALGKPAASQQPSRGERILLSLAILFVVSDVGLFSWYTVKLTAQIDQYVTHSIQGQLGIRQN